MDTPELVQRWGYLSARDLQRALAQHAALRGHLESEGVRVTLADAPIDDGGDVDACYACDPALIGPGGAVILRMGKAERSAEPAAMEASLTALGVPIIGRIRAPGVVEGGDCLWLDEHTLAVADGYRSNPSAHAQLRTLLPGCEVKVFQLAHATGPNDCLHLQSVVAFLDEDLAVIYEPLIPVALIRELLARGVSMLPLPPAEFRSQGGNILCTGPRRVVMAANNPLTAAMLRAADVHVTEIEADQLMVIGTGGPTCLTLPLERG